jgi:hypothetical protein
LTGASGIAKVERRPTRGEDRMLALVLLLLSAPAQEQGAAVAMIDEVRRLRAEVSSLRLEIFQRTDALLAMKSDIGTLRDEVRSSRERGAPSVAAPFLAGPPVPSDLLGVAKTAVFAPRVEADNTRRRDTVTLRVKRIEAGAIHKVAEVELQSDAAGVELPLDQNGALYLVEWFTTEGQSYNLVLKDGASGQPAASAPVKALQAQGRFVFVGYRVE